MGDARCENGNDWEMKSSVIVFMSDDVGMAAREALSRLSQVESIQYLRYLYCTLSLKNDKIIIILPEFLQMLLLAVSVYLSLKSMHRTGDKVLVSVPCYLY